MLKTEENCEKMEGKHKNVTRAVIGKQQLSLWCSTIIMSPHTQFTITVVVSWEEKQAFINSSYCDGVSFISLCWDCRMLWACSSHSHSHSYSLPWIKKGLNSSLMFTYAMGHFLSNFWLYSKQMSWYKTCTISIPGFFILFHIYMSHRVANNYTPLVWWYRRQLFHCSC